MAARSGVSASAAMAAADSASAPSSKRKAPTDTNRIPGSAASMKVQERTKAPTSASSSAASASKSTPSSSSSRSPSSGLCSKTAIQAMQPFLDSTTNSASPIQPTDIQLLTTSILSNQERQRVILFYQERLIDSNPSLLELKKSLLFLSSSSWGQILEERKLADKCSYPPCTNPSPSSSLAGAGRGRFRINLRNKSVKAVEDLDLSEAGNTYDDLRDYFCSKACYARSEWILRWVLGDQEIGLLNKDGKAGGGGGGALGGKWQKLTSHPKGYEQVELLEDIERETGVDFASSDGVGVLDGIGQTEEGDEVPAPEMAAKGKVSDNKVAKLMGDLTIIERPIANGKATRTDPPSTDTTIEPTQSPTPPKKVVQSRTTYTVDVPNTLGTRFTDPSSTSTTSTNLAGQEDEEEDDMDASEREMAHILRFASLATGSRPRPKNTTIRFDNTPPQAASGSKGDESEGEDDEPVVDAKEAAERSEIRRIMDLAMDVRRDQRELGLLE